MLAVQEQLHLPVYDGVQATCKAVIKALMLSAPLQCSLLQQQSFS
jgi:hypothetical protein